MPTANNNAQATALLVLLPMLFASGCFLSPHGSYQVPEALGVGKMGGGGGVGGIFAVGDTQITAIEGQGFFEFGIGESTDLRLRLTGIGTIQQDGGDVFMLGPGMEFKFSFGNIALITGLDLLAPTIGNNDGVCDDGPDGSGNNCSGMHTSLSGHVGAVFGIGDPGSLRLLIAPRIGFSANGLLGLGGLAVGVDLPVGDAISIRPELDGTCYFDWTFGGAICTFGGGVALVF